jgi:ABC-type transport system involved in cytochrome c biogenesis permease subunit
VLLATDNLASSLAARHMWLAAHARTLTAVSNYTRWAAFACSGIAIILGIKSGELLWKRSKPQASPPRMKNSAS